MKWSTRRKLAESSSEAAGSFVKKARKKRRNDQVLRLLINRIAGGKIALLADFLLWIPKFRPLCCILKSLADIILMDFMNLYNFPAVLLLFVIPALVEMGSFTGQERLADCGSEDE